MCYFADDDNVTDVYILGKSLSVKGGENWTYVPETKACFVNRGFSNAPLEGGTGCDVAAPHVPD